MDLKDLLTCNFCNCIFEDPVFLPCHESICLKHVEEIKPRDDSADEIRCPFCAELHQIPSIGFSKNKRFAGLIDREYHKMDFGESHANATKLCKEYERDIGHYENLIKDPEALIHDDVAKLMNKIDLQREESKLRVSNLIDKWHELCYQEIQTYKVESLDKLEKYSFDQNEMIQESRSKLQFWRKKLEVPELSSKELSFENIEKSVRSGIKTLRSKINDVMKNLLNKREFHFTELVLPDYFGHIKVEKKVKNYK